MQVAAGGTVHVFHLRRFKGWDTGSGGKTLKPLKDLLRSPDVIKCGVGISNNVAVLHACSPGLELNRQDRWAPKRACQWIVLTNSNQGREHSKRATAMRVSGGKICHDVGPNCSRMAMHGGLSCECMYCVCRGFQEVVSLAQQAGFQDQGLRTLSAEVLGRQLMKTEQTSDWGRTDLTTEQVKYAVADAWASQQIALKLASHMKLP